MKLEQEKEEKRERGQKKEGKEVGGGSKAATFTTLILKFSPLKSGWVREKKEAGNKRMDHQHLNHFDRNDKDNL